MQKMTKTVSKYEMTTNAIYGGNLHTEVLPCRDTLDDAIEYAEKLVTKRSMNEPVILLYVTETQTVETRVKFKEMI